MTQRRRLQTQREKSRDLGMLDVPYLILTLLLVAVGLIMLFSASYARAYYLTGNSARYFTSQLVFAALGGRNWGVLEIEIIAGREESLLLARPASGVYLSREVLSRLAARGR